MKINEVVALLKNLNKQVDLEEKEFKHTSESGAIFNFVPKYDVLCFNERK